MPVVEKPLNRVLLPPFLTVVRTPYANVVQGRGSYILSGLFRNTLTLLSALLSSFRTGDSQATIASYFWVTPWDTGISTLKSDKYLQFAESAQLDYLIKTSLLSKLLKHRVSFVNAAQLVKFIRPIKLLQRVRVETKIIYTDERCSYFAHEFIVGAQRHGLVLVKMKFKKGAITVDPTNIIGIHSAEKPAYLKLWDDSLAEM